MGHYDVSELKGERKANTANTLRNGRQLDGSMTIDAATGDLVIRVPNPQTLFAARKESQRKDGDGNPTGKVSIGTSISLNSLTVDVEESGSAAALVGGATQCKALEINPDAVLVVGSSQELRIGRSALWLGWSAIPGTAHISKVIDPKPAPKAEAATS